MIRHQGLRLEGTGGVPRVLAVGNFDGVHLGHQAVLGEAVAAAQARGGEAWVLSFSPHPARVLRPESAPPLLTTPDQRARRFAELGLHGWWERPFDRAFAALAPEAFWADLLAATPGLAALRVGDTWRFGRGATGSVDDLQRWGEEAGVEVRGVAGVSIAGARVSSTRIRAAVERGDCAGAAELLGRPYALEGVVTGGDRFARTLGFPTANLATANELFPPDGVYRCRAELRGVTYPAAGYLPAGRQKCEAHLLGYSGDAYGQPLRVEFLARLRPDRIISGLDNLRAQIAEDVRQVAAGWT
jgi:riboflavin kinase/FMN adenylyltransferase